MRRRVEDVDGVRRTWIEWTIAAGMRTPTLVVEYAYELDPASPDFDAGGFAEIMAAADAVEDGEVAPPAIRIVPHTSSG